MGDTNKGRFRELTVLVCIVAMGLTLRVLHWSPSADGDEARYINHAYALAEGEIPTYFDGAIAVRIPYLAFLSLWGAIFGYTTPVLQSSGLAIYVSTAVLVWIITRKLYDSQAAHVATILFATLPLGIVLSTHALTDDFGLLFALGSVLAWIAAIDAPTASRAYFLFPLSGFLAALATGIRQPYFLLGITLPFASWLSGTRLRQSVIATLLFAISALAYFAVEAVAFWVWLGEPLFRISHDVLQNVTESAMLNLLHRPPMSLTQKIFACRGYLPSLLPSGRFGFLPILVGIAMIDRLARQDKRASIPLAILIILTVYHFWGTTSLRAWSLPAVNPRYLIPSMTAGCVLCGGLLSAVHDKYRFNSPTVLSTILLLLIVNTWIVGYGSQPNCVTEFVRHLATLPKAERAYLVLPESVKRYFLPSDYWNYTEGFQVIPDEQLARIEQLDLSRIHGVAVPNETFYSYPHIGVVDALTRTAPWWHKEEIIGEKWPRYLVVTGKASTRVIGTVYYRSDLHGRKRTEQREDDPLQQTLYRR